MTGEKKKITLECQVDNYRSGWTIVEFLSHRFPYHTPDRWHQRVLGRQVTLNGAAVEPDVPVNKDDRVQYTIFHAEPEVDFCYDVIYEDQNILAVSKSGNIPVHSCGVYITHTLIAKLREDYGDEVNLIHRLDRETSGIVLLSKNRETARTLSRMFHRGTVTKRYIAVVYGRIPEERFEVDVPIGKLSYDRSHGERDGPAAAHRVANYLPKRVVDFENGKPAKTCFRRIQNLGDFTMLEAAPVTGRTNQIRVHLHFKGYPIVGDKIYALSGELKDECLRDGLTERVKAALILDRHALHASALEFEHPVTRSRLRLKAPLPNDFHSFIFGKPRA